MQLSDDFQGEVAERSIAAVLKTVVPQGTGGSNPSLSASLYDCSYSSWRVGGGKCLQLIFREYFVCMDFTAWCAEEGNRGGLGTILVSSLILRSDAERALSLLLAYSVMVASNGGISKQT